MNLFELVLCNTVCITFPLVLYLFYLAHERGIGREENTLFLDFAFISSYYLATRLYIGINPQLTYLLLHIPLLMAYRYQQYFSAVLMSGLLCFAVSDLYHISPLYVSLEYIGYFILMITLRKKRVSESIKMQGFLGICAISIILLSLKQPFVSKTTWNLLYALGYIILLEGITQFIIYLFHKGEQILKFHMTIKELEREKQIRMSLFKITHEIKNPIAVCKGYLDMFDPNNEEHTKKYIPVIKEEINRTLILLQDFLSMTKIKIEKDILDINLLLEEVTYSFQPMLKEKKITPKFKISEEEVYLDGDYNRLSQVIVNLLKNSVESMEEGGTLFVKSKKVGKKKIEIEIKDQGCGISEENLKRMTEPFFTTKKHGTGLGVSLSNEIIVAHGGTMKYTSKEGRGTTVKIQLSTM